MVGLGRMGAGMSARLVEGGHRVVVTDLDPEALEASLREGAVAAKSLEELLEMLARPRVVWIMVPAGNPTERLITELGARLAPGEIAIDGGNSNYRDTMRRAATLAERGIHLVDVGTSGGVWGREQGYSLMVGGDPEAFDRIRPALETLAPGPAQGWGRVGPSGSGHFVKMVHNGIEYGLMQAYAEGFEILDRKREFALDLHQVAEIWRSGSVVRSWLLDLTAAALADEQGLRAIRPYVPD
ncbi:MAG: NADP-dependent phosphogluconate dehydrogenase, partial [Vicinamibacteria bacterium]